MRGDFRSFGRRGSPVSLAADGKRFLSVSFNRKEQERFPLQLHVIPDGFIKPTGILPMFPVGFPGPTGVPFIPDGFIKAVTNLSGRQDLSPAW